MLIGVTASKKNTGYNLKIDLNLGTKQQVAQENQNRRQLSLTTYQNKPLI